MSNEKVQHATRSSVGGRPMHEYWRGFTKVYSDSKLLAKCNNCHKSFSNTAKTRMAKHRSICAIGENEDADSIAANKNSINDEMFFEIDSVKNELESISGDNDELQISMPTNSLSTSRPDSSVNQSCDSIDSLEFRCPTAKQQKIERFLDSLLPVETDKIDSIIAEFFYGCNIPFRIVDSIYFKKLVNTLRPAYNIPKRQLLAGKLLDKTREKIEQSNLELISKMDKRMTLLVDAWENHSANRYHIIMMLATSDDQKVFLESFNCSTNRESCTNLFDAIEKSIALADERYGAKVYAVLTDNAYNMRNMSAGYQSLGILYSTCNAHSANLLAGDILKSPAYKKTMQQIKSVQKEIRRIGSANRLPDIGGNKPNLSSNTRWTRQRDSAESLLKNLSAMKTVMEKTAIKQKNKISALLFNDDFIASVRNLLEVLNPVAELMISCQKSTCSAADASEKWMKLLNDGPIDLRNFLEYRLKKSNILNIVTMTANFFHPVYRGKMLNTEQLKEVNLYIFEKLDGEGLESCRQFTTNEGVFASLTRKKITSAKTFWHYTGELGHQNLAAFATDFLKIPASTAQLKRLFTNWSSVHNDIRNRLTEETSKKLMDIYFTFRSFDEIPDDDSGSDDDSDDEDSY